MANRIFRYSERRYADSLLTMGCIRIGTLHDFRRQEHKPGVADSQEGRKSVTHYIDSLNIPEYRKSNPNKSKDERAIEAFSLVEIDDGVLDLVLEDVVFAKTMNAPDCFLLCSSSRLSRKTMNEFDGADTCIEIVEPSLFFRCITETLNAHCPVQFIGVFEIKYQLGEEEWNGHDWGNHPALVKHPEFRSQYEIRAVWRPKNSNPIKPFILANHKLGRYCEIVNVEPP